MEVLSLNFFSLRERGNVAVGFVPGVYFKDSVTFQSQQDIKTLTSATWAPPKCVECCVLAPA